MECAWLPRARRCCCCVPLRAGALAVGYASLAVACAALALSSWSAWRVAAHAAQEAHAPHVAHELAALGCLLVALLYYAAVSLLLVIGVHSDRWRWLRWYVRAVVALVALALALVVLFAALLGPLAAVPLLKWALVLLYCAAMVRSLQLQQQEREQARLKPGLQLRPLPPAAPAGPHHAPLLA